MLRHETLYVNIRVGLDALRIRPVRTLLSVLGILIGSGSLVATMAVSDSMVAFARHDPEWQEHVRVAVQLDELKQVEQAFALLTLFVGAKRKDILQQFLAESVAIAQA